MLPLLLIEERREKGVTVEVEVDDDREREVRVRERRALELVLPRVEAREKATALAPPLRKCPRERRVNDDIVVQREPCDSISS